MKQELTNLLKRSRAVLERLRRNDDGSVFALMVTVPVLAASVAVGIETGNVYRQKRQMQNAADAGALSGAVDLAAGKSTSTVTTTARYEAQRNGLTDGSNGTTVTVNIPPTSGPNAGKSGAVEVVVTKAQSFSLASALFSALGNSNTIFSISARSVAGLSASASTDLSKAVCILALDPSASNAVTFTNDVAFTASSCSIAANSSSVNALTVPQGKVSARTLYLVGNYTGATNITLTEAAHTNFSAGIADPYAGHYAQPTLPGSCTATNYTLSGSSSATINPGRYCGGITQNSSGTLTLTPGTYYIDAGNFAVSSGNVLCSGCTNGAGVTLVLTATSASNIGTIQISNASNIDLMAPGPSSGQPYPGIIIYQDPRISTNGAGSTISGGSTMTFTGVIYLPNTALSVSAGMGNLTSTSGRACAVIIARTVAFNGNNGYEFTKDCSSLGALLPAPSKLMVLE